MSIPTPHIESRKEEIANTVLMPGDPLRAKFIAENFLENAICVNRVRNMLAFTGEYKEKKVTVFGSGMGMPSMGIYSYELFKFYDVDKIIRIGSAGALQKELKLRDIVLGIGACTNSNFANQYQLSGSFAAIADFGLAREAMRAGERLSVRMFAGNIISSDNFYRDDKEFNEKWAKMGVLAVEMEAAALYMNAARTGKKALCMCTISDSMVTGESLDSKAREISFSDMMKIALEIA